VTKEDNNGLSLSSLNNGGEAMFEVNSDSIGKWLEIWSFAQSAI